MLLKNTKINFFFIVKNCLHTTASWIFPELYNFLRISHYWMPYRNYPVES